MKRFIKNLLVFAVTISVITAAVNFVYVKRHRADTDKFAAIPDTIQICNFGSSHGMFGFDYGDLKNDYVCFNFGLSSQTLSYDYRLFQYYGDHLAEGAVVFIPVSYFSLFGAAESSQEDFLSKNRVYYSILPASLIKEYDFQTDLYARYLPALGAGASDLIKTLLGKSRDSLSEFGQRVATDIDIAEDAESVFDSHIIRNKLDNNGNRIKNQEEIDALYALIKGCWEKGAIPVLITTPYLHEYTDIIKENAPDFYVQFYSIIDRVVRDTGVEYYDYAFDERLVNERSCFIDSGHLNREGARIFTNILMEEIVYAKGYLDK